MVCPPAWSRSDRLLRSSRERRGDGDAVARVREPGRPAPGLDDTREAVPAVVGVRAKGGARQGITVESCWPNGPKMDTSLPSRLGMAVVPGVKEGRDAPTRPPSESGVARYDGLASPTPVLARFASSARMGEAVRPFVTTTAVASLPLWRSGVDGEQK